MCVHEGQLHALTEVGQHTNTVLHIKACVQLRICEIKVSLLWYLMCLHVRTHALVCVYLLRNPTGEHHIMHENNTEAH